MIHGSSLRSGSAATNGPQEQQRRDTMLVMNNNEIVETFRPNDDLNSRKANNLEEFSFHDVSYNTNNHRKSNLEV